MRAHLHLGIYPHLTPCVPVQQPFKPKLHMTDADFLSITRNGKLCDDEGGLGEREFELVMREQVSRLRGGGRPRGPAAT